MSRPPFQISTKILSKLVELSRLAGYFEALLKGRFDPQLRKQNQIRTIHSSLAIEGNSLTLDQVSTIFDQKRVIGPVKEITEVKNAISLYEKADEFRFDSSRDFKRAHRILMEGLIDTAGQYRLGNVGIIKGGKVKHIAPKPTLVPGLMEDLFAFIKKETELPLPIRSAIFHYETEFIHPFADGNGRMGRLWQHLMLVHYHPVFHLIPFETIIHEHQMTYYDTLAHCDKAGDSTRFIEFSLTTIVQSLNEVLGTLRVKPQRVQDRLEIARNEFKDRAFSRQAYQTLHKDISTATASRDLAVGTQSGELKKQGDKATARYVFVSRE